MSDKSKLEPPTFPWVGMWKGRRHVVFDPLIQPESKEFMLLYFVQGQSLCTRKKAVDRVDVRTVTDPSAITFALSQYDIWKSLNQSLVEQKKASSFLEIEQPDAIRRKCRICDGMGGYCSYCNGHGFVDNTIEG